MKTSRRKDKNNNVISGWLDKHGSRNITRLVEINLSIANRISDIISYKNITKGELADLMGWDLSFIQGVLSGSISLSIHDIIKVELVLEQNIITIENSFN